MISDTLLESRAFPEYPVREVKAIVPRMTRIVITTMSSTRVKPWRLFLWNFLGVLFVFIMGSNEESKNISRGMLAGILGIANLILFLRTIQIFRFFEKKYSLLTFTLNLL